MKIQVQRTRGETTSYGLHVHSFTYLMPINVISIDDYRRLRLII